MRHLDDVYVYGHTQAAYEQAALGVWGQVDRCNFESYDEPRHFGYDQTLSTTIATTGFVESIFCSGAEYAKDTAARYGTRTMSAQTITVESNRIMTKVSKGLRIGGGGCFILTVFSSILYASEALYYDRPDQNRRYIKAGLDVAVGAIGVRAGYVGFAVGTVYFVLDMAGVVNDALGIKDD